MPRAIRSLWEEPAVPDPPTRVWRDWLLVDLVVVTAVLEALLRPDATWRIVAFALCLLLAAATLYRRTHPLPVVVIVFGTTVVLSLAASAGGQPSFGPYALAFGLVLPYALCRWGSGRDATVGLTFIFLTNLIQQALIGRPIDIVAGFAFLVTSAALGLAVRAATSARRRQVKEYRLLEREQLARELHDTVAHHVSAIAIQAQAAQVVGATDPEAASAALRVIETEATRALTEMRTMVGALRDTTAPALAPQRGVRDLGLLARNGTDAPRVEVHVSGDVDGLPPAVDAAVFRIAQEGVTNALRHARNATRIDVRVVGGDASVRLDVTDDGEPVPPSRQDSGFGLVGMAERVALLDGTFAAGARPEGGWTVVADLPRKGAQL
jgi:signal transduction histidine kinase